MPLTDTELQLIRSGFDTLRDDPAQKSVYFYERLFHHAPHLRGMFRDDIAGQGMRFMSTLAVIVDNLHDPSALGSRYAELGLSHARLGVKAEHFAPMGKALIDTLRHGLGDDFTPEMEAAWTTAYAELSAAILESGGLAPE